MYHTRLPTHLFTANRTVISVSQAGPDTGSHPPFHANPCKAKPATTSHHRCLAISDRRANAVLIVAAMYSLDVDGDGATIRYHIVCRCCEGVVWAMVAMVWYCGMVCYGTDHTPMAVSRASHCHPNLPFDLDPYAAQSAVITKLCVCHPIYLFTDRCMLAYHNLT